MRNLARDIVRSLPARNLVIVNGHGGNRGVLETLLLDLTPDAALNSCVIHPFDLAKIKTSGPDVHGGKSETSVMMEFAPHLVRRDKLAGLGQQADREDIEALVFDRGTTLALAQRRSAAGRSGCHRRRARRLARTRPQDRRQHGGAIPRRFRTPVAEPAARALRPFR